MAVIRVYQGLVKWKDAQGTWHNFDAIQGQQGLRGETGAPGRDGADGQDGRDGVAHSLLYSVSLPTTEWSGSDASGYTRDIAVQPTVDLLSDDAVTTYPLTANDTAVVALDTSEAAVAAIPGLRDEYTKLISVETGNGVITAKVSAVPEIAVPILLRVMR